jgi:GTP cyclohydrolase III
VRSEDNAAVAGVRQRLAGRRPADAGQSAWRIATSTGSKRSERREKRASRSPAGEAEDGRENFAGVAIVWFVSAAYSQPRPAWTRTAIVWQGPGGRP